MKFALIVILAMFCVIMPQAFAQEKTGSLDVFIKTENNDRLYPQGISIKIYQDLGTKPIQEIQSFENNPFTISSLALNHRYKVEVYMNSMYASAGFVDMKKEKETLEITIKNLGGMRLNIFYKDSETPLIGAKILIKSHDGQQWDYTETDQNGQTIRKWLYPSVKEGDFYIAEISIGGNIKHVYSPIRLQPNLAQEFKIVTKWPTIVDKLITVEVYNSTKNKVTKQDGAFIAQLFDSKKNKVAETLVTDKGLAHFSKLKVGNYALHIKQKDSTAQTKSLASKKVAITDEIEILKIYLNNPELNNPYLNCNCVAFRLDDIQDYYLAPAQIEIISTFGKKETPLTVGVIGGVIGEDQRIVTAVKNGLVAKNPIEVANHSWNNRVIATIPKADQDKLIQNTNEKINKIFGVTPTTFIPPENKFNNDTMNVLKTHGFTHISYDASTIEPPLFKKSSFYHFPILPSTANLNAQTGYWVAVNNSKILEKIDESIFEYGYAVVMMHPYEFSLFENGYYVNKVNATKIADLGSLIDAVKSQNLKIVTIRDIQNFDKPTSTKTEEPEPEGLQNCNCIAFRLDNVQDFWLNDVQNTIFDTFDQNKTPLTFAVIGKFIGDDPKVVSHIREKFENKSQIRIASKGWEYVDHTSYDKEKQKASIKQTNDKIKKIFGKNNVLFSPPYDAFNKDTLDAAKESKIIYFSSSITKDPQPFLTDSIKHIPSTLSFTNLIDDDPFYSGTISQKAQAKIQASIKQYGFAVISLQPSDLAVKTDAFKNEINSENLGLLKAILSDLKSNQINIVMLESIPDSLSVVVIPDWIKNNAKWWSEGKIGDSDFIKGLQYLIEQDVIKIPQTTPDSSTQKIPDWIKNNAKWWSEGKIGNGDFVKGIQYLVQNGIITV
jgi:peptidoglycan/xylan/chitin deacetylase (PgdA/CDA1 family)